MPDRLIKQSIWTSPNLNQLSDQAEKCFYRLLLASDDWGCFDANPLVIKGKCFPLQPATDTTCIENCIKELEKQELIKTWVSGNRIYGQFLKFEQHNPLLQRHEPSTPCPPWMLDNNNLDTRLASETLQAFHRIAVAIASLNNNSHKPTYKEICENARCSPSTLSKYYKYAQTKEDNVIHYSPLQPTTDTTATTDKNHNPNHNPNIRNNIGENVNDKILDDIKKQKSISFEEYKMQLKNRFTTLDFDAEYEKFTTHWSEGRKSLKRPKTALLNWMNNAVKFQQENKNNGTYKRDIKGQPGNQPSGAFADIQSEWEQKPNRNT